MLAIKRSLTWSFILMIALGTCAWSASEEELKAEMQRLLKHYLTLKKEGKYKEALKPTKRLVELVGQALGQENEIYANTLSFLAGLYRKTNKYTKAEFLHKRALAIKEKALGENHPSVGVELGHLAMLYDQMLLP